MGRAHYLDGLRGIAALMVMLSHVEPFIITAFVGKYAPSGILASIFYMCASGSLAVAIFFVLSGFVLVGSFDKIGGNALGVGAAKRYFRLSPPIVASMVVTYALVKLVGYHGNEAAAMMGGHGWLASQTQDNLTFIHAIYAGFMAPFIGGNPHNGVLWTMNVEFLGSIGLFGFAALFYRSKIYWMCVFVAATVFIYLLGIYGMHFSMFLFGSLFFRYRKNKLPSFALLLIPIGFLFGALRSWHGVMLSIQHGFGYSDGTAFQVQIFLNSLGGLLIVVAVIFCSPCKRFLSKKLFEYFGKISFSLYLIHLPVFLSIGCITYVKLTQSFGSTLSASIAIVVTFAITVLCADVIYRTADKFSMWLSDRIRDIFAKTFDGVHEPSDAVS